MTVELFLLRQYPVANRTGASIQWTVGNSCKTFEVLPRVAAARGKGDPSLGRTRSIGPGTSTQHPIPVFDPHMTSSLARGSGFPYSAVMAAVICWHRRRGAGFQRMPAHWSRGPAPKAACCDRITDCRQYQPNKRSASGYPCLIVPAFSVSPYARPKSGELAYLSPVSGRIVTTVFPANSGRSRIVRAA